MARIEVAGAELALDVIDAALEMVEQLLMTSNEFASRVTESAQRILPELGCTIVLRDTGHKAPAPKSTAKTATTSSTTQKQVTTARG